MQAIGKWFQKNLNPLSNTGIILIINLLIHHQNMNDPRNISYSKNVIKGRPDYYITPTRDFTQYTRDCEEKYWRKETAFDWQQNIKQNLEDHLEHLSPVELPRIIFLVLPLLRENIKRKIEQIQKEQLPMEEDALKDIGDCLASDKLSLQRALMALSPLHEKQYAVAKLNDRVEILQKALIDVREQQRLGLFGKETAVKQLETEAERKEQEAEISGLSNQLNQIREELNQLRIKDKTEGRELKVKIRSELNSFQPQVLSDLEETLALIQHTLQSAKLPGGHNELLHLKELVLKRQLRGLKDIANHALVVEQSAIAPLTMGIIHYKRYREIQEALTTFVHDEAKHSATFRRFLVEKLEAKEFISDILIKGANRYMWIARFMPGVGMFLAVIVEAIGAAYLEFFAKKEYMPDKLFRSICETISQKDEKRHMDLCVAMYNELFRVGHRWERFRNNIALKRIMKSVYGDKTDDHHLIQAFRAFGVESDALYNHIMSRLSTQLARINMYVEPQTLLRLIGRNQIRG